MKTQIQYYNIGLKTRWVKVHRTIHLQRLERSLARVRLKSPEAQGQENQDSPSPEGLTAEELTMMNELDENGWAPIHQAAFYGYVKSVEKFVKASEDQLELETGDDLHSTPLLLAVMSGNLETVKCLTELGADVAAINSQNNGVVELCAFKHYIDILNYFIAENNSKLPVWKNLIKFFASDMDEESQAAGKTLRTLTQRTEEGINSNWEAAFNNGIVPTAARVIKSTIGDAAKVQCFHVLLNLLEESKVKEQFMSSGGMVALVKHLKVQNHMVITLAATCIKEICVVKEYADSAAQCAAIQALVKVTQTIHDSEVLVETVLALCKIAYCKAEYQTTIGKTPNAISSLSGLFENCTHKPLLMALTEAVSTIGHLHVENQNSYVQVGVAPHIITLTRVKNKDVQLNAVDALYNLAENNPHTQKVLLEEGCVNPLMNLLKKSRQPSLQEKTARALWALAGEDADERRNMANLIGVQLLIDFLTASSEYLHFIGSDGLGVLAQGPLNKQTAIANANGVHPLVRLLKSDKERIVLSVIRTLRYLCVGVGYVPHVQNQTTVAQSRGIKFLVAMMVHSSNELIQVEAAHTLGCVALGHSDNLAEIQENLDFSYVRILKMMYSQNELVRLLAGAALAAFAFNSLSNQKEIAQQGGVRFNCFVPFLQSEDEFYRCNAAFQVVTLARIIPDEEQAISSAAGIKLLVDLLQDSKSNETLALTADCIARLSHTRAGVPSAFVAIQSVDLLCNLMLSLAEQVRGSAALALGYLSYNHGAKRQLLNRCRLDPYLIKILTYYTKNGRLCQEFLEGWKHYKQIGLPPIGEGRPTLVGKTSVHYRDLGRPLTINTLDETGTSTNIQSSPTNLHSHPQEDERDDKLPLTARSSQESRLSTHSHLSARQSHMSDKASQRSRNNSIMSAELLPEVTASDGGQTLSVS